MQSMAVVSNDNQRISICVENEKKVTTQRWLKFHYTERDSSPKNIFTMNSVNVEMSVINMHAPVDLIYANTQQCLAKINVKISHFGWVKSWINWMLSIRNYAFKY